MSTLAAPRIETVSSPLETLAIIVRSGPAPDRTRFITPPHSAQQVGYIAYPRDGVIPAHRHRPVERRLVGTGEVLFVLQGRCEADLYDREDQLMATRELAAGDLLVLMGAGHGFRMLEDTVFLEIKQGPYTGDGEKEFL
ncbi:MAG: hypothetical protein IT449_16190 [Phycisphaerales bacterium]|nr:hypothetical protein [Phycisphaerales bacterium]